MSARISCLEMVRSLRSLLAVFGLSLLSPVVRVGAFTVVRSTPIAIDIKSQHARPNTGSVALSMGIFDSISSFLQQRDGDFIKLEETETFGPGPLLVLYKVPYGVQDEEIQDMLEDGAPRSFQKGVTLVRIPNDVDPLLDDNMQDALTKMTTPVEKEPGAVSDEGCPVLFFSGFDNPEMISTYNILGQEIYMETGKSSACAKCVPNAMEKPLRQVLEEISSDHMRAVMGDGDDVGELST